MPIKLPNSYHALDTLQPGAGVAKSRMRRAMAGVPWEKDDFFVHTRFPIVTSGETVTGHVIYSDKELSYDQRHWTINYTPYQYTAPAGGTIGVNIATGGLKDLEPLVALLTLCAPPHGTYITILTPLIVAGHSWTLAMAMAIKGGPNMLYSGLAFEMKGLTISIDTPDEIIKKVDYATDIDIPLVISADVPGAFTATQFFQGIPYRDWPSSIIAVQNLSHTFLLVYSATVAYADIQAIESQAHAKALKEARDVDSNIPWLTYFEDVTGQEWDAAHEKMRSVRSKVTKKGNATPSWATLGAKIDAMKDNETPRDPAKLIAWVDTLLSAAEKQNRPKPPPQGVKRVQIQSEEYRVGRLGKPDAGTRKTKREDRDDEDGRPDSPAPEVPAKTFKRSESRRGSVSTKQGSELADQREGTLPVGAGPDTGYLRPLDRATRNRMRRDLGGGGQQFFTPMPGNDNDREQADEEGDDE